MKATDVNLDRGFCAKGWVFPVGTTALRLLALLCLAGSILLAGCGNPDRDYEKAFQSQDISAFENVLKKHPDHPRASEARARLGELLWESARHSRDAAMLANLLRDYPQAAFSAEAKTLWDDVSWEKAQGVHTEVSYESYIAAHPKGLHVAEANAAIEEIVWQAAFDAETVDAVRAFVTRFPQSTRKAEADTRIKHLHRQKYVKVFEQNDLDAFKELDDGTLAQAIREAFWWPPLLLAADTRAEKIASYLIENGADVNERGEDQTTALHLAARAGSVGMVKLLLAHKAELDAEIKSGASFVQVGEGGSMTYHTPPPTAKKGTPLHWAAYYNRPEVLAYLIERGANVNADDGYGNNPIHFAAQSGSMEMIHALLKAGADWREKKKERYERADATPLHYAGTAEVAEFFVQQGIAIDTDSDLGQPIHAAVYFGQQEVVEYLLAKGAGINATCSWGIGALSSVTASPLWIAASSGTPAMIDYLASKGGDLRYRVGNGGTLLHAAAWRGNAAAVQHLVAKGLDLEDKADFPHAHPMVRGWEGITPLGVAVHYQEIAAARALLDAGADVNAQFEDVWTPLYVAIVGRNLAVVSLLLDHAAKLPFPYSDISSRNTSDEIKELLKKHFAKGGEQ